MMLQIEKKSHAIEESNVAVNNFSALTCGVFRQLSVPGNDGGVRQSAIRASGELAHDFRQETQGSDKLGKSSIGQLTRILHVHD